MLKDKLREFERGKVIDDCVRVLEDEVASKKGLSGFAVKGAFKVIGAVKPGFIRAVVNGLLDEFVAELEPFYADWVEKDMGDFGSHLNRHAKSVANALLQVTDKRAERTVHQTAKKAYLKLRPSGVDHVTEAMPRLGALLNKYLEN